MHTSRNTPAIAEAYDPLVNAHGRDIVEAVITGGAVASPRSTIPNYAEILVAVVVRTPTRTKSWIESLMAIVSRLRLLWDQTQLTRCCSKDIREKKRLSRRRRSFRRRSSGTDDHSPRERRIDIFELRRSRTPQRIKAALNEFALVCRGLANSAYGNASVI